MSKETNIIFLYDTELLKFEEDDPNSAIIYFHPIWVSDYQKTALCGQIMGTIMCLKALFSMPKNLSLQTGKFHFTVNGRFILVIGSDRNVSDWILEHRANFLYGLLNFYHKDFINLKLLYERDKFKDKLTEIFDTYLKFLYLSGNIFNSTILLDTSKMEEDVLQVVKKFLNKIKLLRNVHGEIFLYHNKVVHSELSIEISKKIVFSDPYHIKNPAEINTELPQGVKLFQVYLPPEELNNSSESLLLECSSLWEDPVINCQYYFTNSSKKENKEKLKIPLIINNNNNNNTKTDKDDDDKLKKCILFMYGHKDIVVGVIITKSDFIIEELHSVCCKEIPIISQQLEAGISITKSISNENNYTMLKLNSDWNVVDHYGQINNADLIKIHGEFLANNQISDIYLRKTDSVILGHKEGDSELFYEEPACFNKGLINENDNLGKIQQNAKRNLEINHNIILK